MSHVLPLTPQLRGHVDPRLIAHWRSAGWHVHQVGQAAYVHSPEHHLIFGVWARHDLPPAWAGRLGRVSEGYLRRAQRLERERRSRLFRRDELGRFVARLPWWAIRPVQVHRHEPAPLSFVELEAAEAARARARLRERGWVA